MLAMKYLVFCVVTIFLFGCRSNKLNQKSEETQPETEKYFLEVKVMASTAIISGIRDILSSNAEHTDVDTDENIIFIGQKQVQFQCRGLSLAGLHKAMDELMKYPGITGLRYYKMNARASIN
jgi:hypothetical protein